MKAEVDGVLRIRPEVAARLGYYVYGYVDPRTTEVFYVGKGCRGRALAHLDEDGESAKVGRIASIKAAGLEPRIDILAHGLEDEATALRIEAAVIGVLWPAKVLTNKVQGFKSLEFGRTLLSELHFQYAAKSVKIDEPCMLIRINKLYRPGMSEIELYEATRGVWKCNGARRDLVRYGLAVFQGVVRQVYSIEAWHKAGTLPYTSRKQELFDPQRWEFSGKIASELTGKYVGRSVEKYFTKGAQQPFTYVNC